MTGFNGAPLLANAMMGRAEEDIIQGSLHFVREHLSMEVGYLSEFVGDTLVYRHVSASGLEALIAPGMSVPLSDVYCRHILAGRLPEMMPDTSHEPLTQQIPITRSLPIRAHVSIPILRRDGTAYGMFCCLSRRPQPSLNDRDLEVMRAFARLSGDTINETLARRAEVDGIRNRIRAVMENNDFHILYQPIMDSRSRRPKGFEALCRFSGKPHRTPDLWFREAGDVGLQVDLEICAIVEAIRATEHLPIGTYVSVNASPLTIESGRLADVLRAHPAERIVIEITEHSAIDCYDTLLKQLNILRFMGVRVAIDDAGAGYSGLQQILRLRPDVIKLDISLTKRIDVDVVRRSLASAMVEFAGKTGALIVAEGVETQSEFDTLLDLGVDLMQGYLLGRPDDLGAALTWFQDTPWQRGAV
ncbi:MAG: EAL domain-containing protein [Pseudomonadota bacterium]